MIGNKKKKELQQSVKSIIRYCESQKECNENCVFYKNRIGCTIEIPTNWHCDYFLIQKF